LVRSLRDFGEEMELPADGSALARQGSIYSLTFDEFQSALGSAGKDFGSMNMDELLRNIWTAEESQAIAPPAAASAAVVGDAQQQQQQPPIQRQGSLTLPRTLSQKTVDEVWRDIMGLGGDDDDDPAAAAAAAAAAAPAQRQPTLGEMTLEEFLVRAGVVREDMGQTIVLPPQAQALFPGSNVVAPAMQLANGMLPGVVGVAPGAAAAMTVAAPATPVVLNGLGKVEGGDLSSLSPVPYPFDTALRVRKGPTVEKVVERRQRRMIKNRESAARSRARKQVKPLFSSTALGCRNM
jgi:ABA responsive element binding factor